jgi:hypothetical protein
VKFHDGQILRISDLSVPAKVSDHGFGRNANNDGDCLRIVEIREDRRASAYSYHRKDGEGWADCTGEPVTVELIEDAPKPYRVGAENFVGEMLAAILEGQAVILPSVAAEFAEAVRNHVATEGCGEQWRALALARLRGGYDSLYEPEKFIEYITAFDVECGKPWERREAFYDKRRNG